MCGILCHICFSEHIENVEPKLQQRIENRGPDITGTLLIKKHGVHIRFCGSVLWMQGQKAVPQPVETNEGVFLYNGDIFDRNWSSERSDTKQIVQKLSMCNSTGEIVNEITSLKGPFSLVYYSKLTNELIFSRDRVGRNSLLFCEHNEAVIISSVLGRNYDCIEIPASNIYALNFLSKTITLYSWNHGKHEDSKQMEYTVNDWYKSMKVTQSLPDEEFLLENISAVDLHEDPVVQLIESTASQTTNKATLMEELLNNFEIKKVVSKLISLLNSSIELRLTRQPNKCKACINSSVHCSHSAVGILFSGGLDCTILAYLADKYVPKEQSIDLINVAFKKDDKSSYDVPDRLTGMQSLDELMELCPNRKWILKKVNIPKEVLTTCQENIISDLVYPRQTILDESLGSALWFASKGDDDCMKSPSRVLILGSGADELFGGYTRHRNAFKRHGWIGLANELQLDWKRISFRNLARDNRVICDHGRQPRMPYLDEDFTDYVLNLKPWFKCFPSDQLGIGIGDKLFLRLVAFHLGLKNVAIFPKRALQFGSRIANKKEKGNHLSNNLLSTSEKLKETL